MLGVSNIVEGPFRSANLGYWVARDHNGRGIATAAVGLAVGWAFEERGLHRLEAGTLLDNVGSQRVLEQNGFSEIGISPPLPEHRRRLARPRAVRAHGRLTKLSVGQAARTCCERAGQVLGHHPHVGQHGHEVRVAVPARHDVEVQVAADTRPGDAAEVDARVEALR